MKNPSRRHFLKNGLALGGALALPVKATVAAPLASGSPPLRNEERFLVDRALDLAPARWIWFPSDRCLPNTVIFFRKSLILPEKPLKASGWILADSRYKLYANGERVQFGPAPADPRWAEADPVDLSSRLSSGENTVGAEVLYYGLGDGTWPIGKPGFIFYLHLEFPGAPAMTIVSDDTWQTAVAGSWKPGQYKRWYLRAFQEVFDARLYPYGWNSPSFQAGGNWRAAMLISGAANKPVIAAGYRDYLYDSQAQPADAELRARSITPVRERMEPAMRLSESMLLNWKTTPEEYFDFVTPDPFEVISGLAANETGNGSWLVPALPSGQAAALTFEFREQIVGFPYFTIEAPEGTVVELLVHEAHQPGTHPLINTHFHSWTRFVCREGVNRFETFDYESLRWLQLHIRNSRAEVKIREIGVRRRLFDWRNEPLIRCSDGSIQKVVNAALNTLYNCAIETIVDGMGRERQQYSGDVGHVLHSVFMTMGEPSMAARFINTFSQGITRQGFFLDCWPAFDRLARLVERELQLTEWGPLLDHGVGFNFDCYHYYLYTGEVEQIREVFPRLIRFYRYLLSIRKADGLLPVEDIGVPVVWMDHQAYQKPRHKQCAFNLYASAMMQQALAPLCRAFGEPDLEAEVMKTGKALLKAAQQKFWSASDGLFVNNLPWLPEEKSKRLCDRSLAMALLFDLCPGGVTAPAVKALEEPPSNLGLSYPANANWRYWALSAFGKDTFLKEIRDKWSKMASVHLNNTLSEDWTAAPDSGAQWSHCPIAPLFGMHMCVAGIRPLKPGFEEVEIAPVMGDLAELELTTYTVRGPIYLKLQQQNGKLAAEVDLPVSIQGHIQWKGIRLRLTGGKQKLEWS